MFKVTVNDDNSDELKNETIVTYLNHERLSYDVVSNILIFPPHNYDIISVTFDFEREFNQLLNYESNNATYSSAQDTANNANNKLGDVESLETNAEIFYHVFKEDETKVFSNEKVLLRVLQSNNNKEREELLSNYRHLLNFHQLRMITEEENEEIIQVIHKPIGQLEERDIMVELTPYSSISQRMNPLDAQVNDKFYSDDEFSEFSEGGSYDVVDLLSSTGSETDSSEEGIVSNNKNGEIGEHCSSDFPFFDSDLFSNYLETLQTDKHVILRFDENSGTDFKTRSSLLGSRDVEINKNELNKLEDLFFASEKPIIKKLREDKVLYHLLLVALCRDIGLSAIVN
ncbi:predicted protein [Naegleria gruberi]|uniref:Predicted protein n=1 Tax=Naegleria gruberi TaxID=5762 RepID=D2VBY2_NAEGR|nr:uncharacterized protein NAEGRDRAFT_66378 [Naegleria gruberi]EFC45557.1 predicted protein [Naegleria gruberi]|eukprot:XP_002678301.1 predicted protein [Naegleria gruberi strain NEG-M]